MLEYLSSRSFKVDPEAARQHLNRFSAAAFQERCQRLAETVSTNMAEQHP